MPSAVEALIGQVVAWAAVTPAVRAVALVGSHARGAARSDSDVDFIVVADPPARLLDDTRWSSTFGAVARQRTEKWGRVTSLRVSYRDGLEVEFGVADSQWADQDDESSSAVLRDGARVLFDPQGLFDFLKLQ
jgi:predicted nucleotidyltransferase